MDGNTRGNAVPRLGNFALRCSGVLKRLVPVGTRLHGLTSQSALDTEHDVITATIFTAVNSCQYIVIVAHLLGVGVFVLLGEVAMQKINYSVPAQTGTH